MGKILHQLETMGNRCLLVLTGESFQSFSGARFRPSVWMHSMVPDAHEPFERQADPRRLSQFPSQNVTGDHGPSTNRGVVCVGIWIPPKMAQRFSSLVFLSQPVLGSPLKRKINVPYMTQSPALCFKTPRTSPLPTAIRNQWHG